MPAAPVARPHVTLNHRLYLPGQAHPHQPGAAVPLHPETVAALEQAGHLDIAEVNAALTADQKPAQ